MNHDEHKKEMKHKYNDHELSQDMHSNPNNEIKYYCPMKCEGEKTYNEPGNCPVCNMHLILVEDGTENNKAAHNEEHAHHHKSGMHQETSHPKDSAKDQYYCPMRCEGNKVYSEPGDCPVCGMHLKKVESQSGKSFRKTIYTCPMHPEVKQDHPGSCPKCGMNLVPEKK